MLSRIIFPRAVRLGVTYLKEQTSYDVGRTRPKTLRKITITVHDDGGPDRGPLADRQMRFRVYGMAGAVDAAEDAAEAVAAVLRDWPIHDSRVASIGPVRGPWVVSDVDASPELLITADVTLIGATS